MSRFIGRGRIYLAERNGSGVPQRFWFVGCADDFDIALGVELEQKYSKCTSADALAFQRVRRQNADVSMTLTEWSLKNLLLATRGTHVPDATGGSVANEAAGSGFEIGDVYVLGQINRRPRTNVSNVAVSDGVTVLDVDVDYTLDADNGTITFLIDTAGAVTIDYDYDDVPYISFFTAGVKDYWLRFNGVNAVNEEPAFGEFYKVQFNPAAALGMHTDESAPLALTGAVLSDEFMPADDDFGQFGRMSVLT